jgi:hypothetical protein
VPSFDHRGKSVAARMASILRFLGFVLLPTLAIAFSHNFPVSNNLKSTCFSSNLMKPPRQVRLANIPGLKAIFQVNEQKESGSIKMPISLQEERLEADRVLSRATEEGKLSLKEVEQLQQEEAEELQRFLEQVFKILILIRSPKVTYF